MWTFVVVVRFTVTVVVQEVADFRCVWMNVGIAIVTVDITCGKPITVGVYKTGIYTIQVREKPGGLRAGSFMSKLFFPEKM